MAPCRSALIGEPEEATTDVLAQPHEHRRLGLYGPWKHCYLGSDLRVHHLVGAGLAYPSAPARNDLTPLGHGDPRPTPGLRGDRHRRVRAGAQDPEPAAR